MPVRTLFVSPHRDGSVLPWAGPDVLVDTLRDPLDLPFRLMRNDVDIIVTAVALPQDLGPWPVPVVRTEDIPPDPRSGWEMIRRAATQTGRSGAPDSRRMLSEALYRLQSDIDRTRADMVQLERQMSDLLPPLVSAVARASQPLGAPAEQSAAALESPPPSPPPAPAPSPAPVPSRYPRAEAYLPFGGPESDRRAPPEPVPLTLLVGPVARLPLIEALVDDLEYAPGLSLQFRVFRAGVYQIDGQSLSPRSLVQWLEARADVAAVSVQGATVHVTPRLS